MSKKERVQNDGKPMVEVPFRTKAAGAMKIAAVALASVALIGCGTANQTKGIRTNEKTGMSLSAGEKLDAYNEWLNAPTGKDEIRVAEYIMDATRIIAILENKGINCENEKVRLEELKKETLTLMASVNEWTRLKTGEIGTEEQGKDYAKLETLKQVTTELNGKLKELFEGLRARAVSILN